MKTKPVLITLGILVVAATVFFFVRGRFIIKNEKSEILQFLISFNNQVKQKNVDSVLTYFDATTPTRTLKRLANLLTERTSANGKEKSLVRISLNIDATKIQAVGSEFAVAKIPTEFTHDSVDSKATILNFKIRKVGSHKYKIVQVQGRRFLNDYLTYETLVRDKTADGHYIYDTITLEAFKTAVKLKNTYDSVLYFEHVNGKTFYYVARGKFESYDGNGNRKDTDSYKIGLVNPDLKEVIPVEYDVIHNIGGTIDGLIEVEKGSKKGFFTPDGKLVVDVNYDQIIPFNDSDENLALLKNGDDYYYLNKSLSVSDKLTGFKIETVIPKIRKFEESYSLLPRTLPGIIEYNVKENNTSIVFPPSYLVDLKILSSPISFNNPLRKYSYNGHVGQVDEGDLRIDINYTGSNKEETNWFESVFYSVIDSYVDGRSGLYENNTAKKLLFVDKKNNRLMGYEARNFILEDTTDENKIRPLTCNENYFRSINDTLFEFITTAGTGQRINLDSYFSEGPSYHYLHIKDGKLVELPNDRVFGCTKYVKLNDSYLNACFVTDNGSIDHMTPAILQYMKNEIFASYKYKFKSKVWADVFQSDFGRYTSKLNDAVDDSLTDIDKYNINWINQKLKGTKANSLAAK